MTGCTGSRIHRNRNATPTTDNYRQQPSEERELTTRLWLFPGLLCSRRDRSGSGRLRPLFLAFSFLLNGQLLKPCCGAASFGV
jgi:hypothetical protein